MKIAVITLFCREWFRAEAWKQYYDGYKEDVYLHVIVNNGDAEDTDKLKDLFPDSLVLRSETPNMMASYNLALREILLHPEVDAIAQIVNDIRLASGGLRVLYAYLFREPGLAMVSPVLLKKDSEIVDSLGCEINPKNLNFEHNEVDRPLQELGMQERFVTALPAGIVLARRDLYEQFGFQDEDLMMYADEIDMGIRVARLGYRLGATTATQAWHQHVNPEGRAVRSMRAAFLIGRNPVYIARKYYSPGRVAAVFLYRIYRGLDEVRSAVMHRKGKEFRRFGWYLVKGAFAGMTMRCKAIR